MKCVSRFVVRAGSCSSLVAFIAGCGMAVSENAAVTGQTSAEDLVKNISAGGFYSSGKYPECEVGRADERPSVPTRAMQLAGDVDDLALDLTGTTASPTRTTTNRTGTGQSRTTPSNACSCTPTKPDRNVDNPEPVHCAKEDVIEEKARVRWAMWRSGLLLTPRNPSLSMKNVQGVKTEFSCTGPGTEQIAYTERYGFVHTVRVMRKTGLVDEFADGQVACTGRPRPDDASRGFEVQWEPAERLGDTLKFSNLDKANDADATTHLKTVTAYVIAYESDAAPGKCRFVYYRNLAESKVYTPSNIEVEPPQFQRYQNEFDNRPCTNDPTQGDVNFLSGVVNP